MPNGAHHSDLRHTRPCPAPDDTPDVLAARTQAARLFMRWLSDVRSEVEVEAEAEALESEVAMDDVARAVAVEAEKAEVEAEAEVAVKEVRTEADEHLEALSRWQAALPTEAERERCLDDTSECLAPPSDSATCRIHTDSPHWSNYPWRNAYTPAAPAHSHLLLGQGAPYATHEYGVCSDGKPPWAFTANSLSVAECAAKCTSLSCGCFE